MCQHVSIQHASIPFFRIGGNKITTASERDQRNEDAGKGSDCKHSTFSTQAEESQVFFPVLTLFAVGVPFFWNMWTFKRHRNTGLNADVCFSCNVF